MDWKLIWNSRNDMKYLTGFMRKGCRREITHNIYIYIYGKVNYSFANFFTYTIMPLNTVFVERIVSLINSTCIEDDGFTTT